MPVAGLFHQVRCKITTQSKNSGNYLLSYPVINAEKIAAILYQCICHLDDAEPIYITKLVIHAGCFSVAQFEQQFYPCLASALTDGLERYIRASRPTAACFSPAGSTVQPAELLAGLRQNTPSLSVLACCCLKAEFLQTLLQFRPASQLQLLLKRLLTEKVPDSTIPLASAYCRVTTDRLAMAALRYLLADSEGQRWLSEHPPGINQLQSWGAAIHRGEIAAEQLISLLTPPLPSVQLHTAIRRWLLPLWQQNRVRNLVCTLPGIGHGQQIDAWLRGMEQPSSRSVCQQSKALTAGLLSPAQPLWLQARDNGEDRAVGAQRPAPLPGSRIRDNGEDRAVDAQRPAPLPGSRIRDNGEDRAVDAQRPAPLPGSRIRDNGEDRAVDAQRPAPLSGSRIQDNGEDRAVDAHRPAPLPGSRIRDNGEDRAVDAQRPAPLSGSRIQDNGEDRAVDAQR
ncbi:hypothetical protein ACGVWS_06650, partial [Enterobacteriaceae bacterium LUAb1]